MVGNCRSVRLSLCALISLWSACCWLVENTLAPCAKVLKTIFYHDEVVAVPV